MRAVIMAGGRGTRLAPYTTVLPKPLMPIVDRPILDVIINQLAVAGFSEIVVSVGHLGSLIESWVHNHCRHDVAVELVHEHAPLGTAGALRNLDLPGDPFLALNGDVLTTMDFGEFLAAHAHRGEDATVAVHERAVPVDWGVVHDDADGNIVALEEKPSIRLKCSMGVYALSRRVCQLIEPGERLDFPDLLLRAITHGHRVVTHTHRGYWCDIGNREDYEQAVEDFSSDPGSFIPERPAAAVAERTPG